MLLLLITLSTILTMSSKSTHCKRHMCRDEYKRRLCTAGSCRDKVRGVREAAFSSEVFVLLTIIFSTVRAASGQHDSQISGVVNDLSEPNGKHLKNSTDASTASGGGRSLKIESIAIALGVDSIKNNNTLSTTEVVVKENYQERQQQEISRQAANSSAKLSSHSTISANANENANANASTTVVKSTPPSLLPSPSSSLSAKSTLIAVVPTGYSSPARNFINSINRDNVLKRQLREKAKHDSLESIKMNILMRLKLEKLPNITSPIAVPQRILEKFYKNYNATRSNNDNTQYLHGSQSRSPSAKNRKNIRAQESHITHRSFGPSDDFYMDGSDNLSNNEQVPKMQSDDSYAYPYHKHYFGNDELSEDQFVPSGKYEYVESEYYDEEEHNEGVMSHINSIYLFPEISRFRHKRKPELLYFKVDNSLLDITRATMHLYLRGSDWIRDYLPKLSNENMEQQRNNVVVAIHRALRQSNSTVFSHKLKVLESTHPIPSGVGQWVKIDVLTLFASWLEKRNEPQEILIKGVEPWMKNLIVTTDNTAKSPLTVHIEIETQTKHRYKRSTSLDCQESDHEDRCCRYPLKVNFTNFGWHFVVAPTSFDAYFCNGECKVGYLEQYTHTHLTSLTASATPCCSPTKMSALNLLYFDDNNKLVMSVIPNMSVEKCSCS